MKRALASAVTLAAVVVSVAAVPTVTLRNAAQPGVEMPTLGLGTGAYGNTNGTFGEYWDDITAFYAASKWLELGGRRLDTSLKYYNDLAGVGWAVGNSSVNRSDIFITSKVDDPYGYNTTIEHIDAVLATLNVDYVDLLLMHWPGPTFFLNHSGPPIDQWCSDNGPLCRQQTWAALEVAFKAGKARAIGVANFEQRHLEDIMAVPGSLLPALNQIEFHPYWHEDALVAYCHSLNITTNSYAPLGAPDFMGWNIAKWPVPIMSQPAIIQIAASYKVTPAQVLLQYSLQNGMIANPRTRNPAHMLENLAVVDPATAFTLSAADLAMIAAMPAPQPPNNKVCPDPNLTP